MSLATRCPTCGTIFRVVQDQLKVSEGWVRCGQCHEVFHGIEALFDLESDPAIAARRAARAAQTSTPDLSEPSSPPSLPERSPASLAASARPSTTVSAIAVSPRDATATPVSMAPSTAPAVSAATTAPTAAATRAVLPPAPQFAPPPATHPPVAGFAPAADAPPANPVTPAPSTTPATTVARANIAPRFAARLAEEEARAQAAGTRTTSFPEPPPAGLTPASAPASAAAATPLQAPPPPPPSPLPPPIAPTPIAAPVPPTSPGHSFAVPVDATFPPPTMVVTPHTVADEPPGTSPEPAGSAPFMPSIVAESELPEPTPAPAARQPRAITLKAPASPTPSGRARPAREAIAADSMLQVGRTTPPERLAEHENDEAHAGPPTLASMLPEVGEWPPRNGARKRRQTHASPQAADTASGATLPPARDDDPRFLREAQRGVRWSKPWVRAVLGATLGVLTATAVLQAAYPQRDTLAARWPATLPAWKLLCETAGCTIEPPRAIASLALDGSSLTRTDTDHVLLFSADLHNRADHEVRMPSFDLSFMDLNGAIVARKVLSPEQIGIHQAALAPETELHVHARIAVGGNLDASGFQAEMFYP